MLLLHQWLAPLLQLPSVLLCSLATTSLLFALYSFSLAARPRLRRHQVRMLILGNSLYALVCLLLLILFMRSATLWGVFYLTLECSFVTLLVIIERRLAVPVFHGVT